MYGEYRILQSLQTNIEIVINKVLAKSIVIEETAMCRIAF